MKWFNVKVKLGDLKPWEDNPRYSTPKQSRMILKSVEQFGQVKIIAIGPNNEVYDGHQRLSALLAYYGPDHVVDARECDGELTIPERRGLVMALHAVATGEWDWDKLANWDVEMLLENGLNSELLNKWNADIVSLQSLIDSETVPTFDEFDETIADGMAVCECDVCGNKHAKQN